MLACCVIRVCLWPCVLIMAAGAGAAQPPGSPAAPGYVQPDAVGTSSPASLPCSTAVVRARPASSTGAFCLRVYNFGAIGQARASNLLRECSLIELDQTLYEGSFVLAADSIDAPDPDGGAVFRAAFGGLERRFMPDPAPYGGECGFDHWADVPLGHARVGGCPGTRSEISGDVVASAYIDTLFEAVPGSRQAAAGVRIIQTVVGTHDARYGDFVLFRWDIVNRDATAKGPWHAGTYIDWNVGDYEHNDGNFSDAFNGYFIWNPLNPTQAFGMLDPDQPSLYSTINPAARSPYRIYVFSEYWRYLCCWDFCPGCWGGDGSGNDAWSWWTVVHQQPLRKVESGPGNPEDKSGLLINQPFSLAPNGSAAIHQALFWVEATSNDPAIIEANATDVARRAARWAGFARGDVNEDGYVDLADVCWLVAGLPIYPDTYCADVDADGDFDSADIRYLLDFVSASGPGPQGAWRFQLPPEP
jgi:hypothetical protein